MPGSHCGRKLISLHAWVRAHALADDVGSDLGEPCGPIDCQPSGVAVRDGSIGLLSRQISFCCSICHGKYTPLPHGMQPLTRSTGCLSGTVREEGHHGTRGQMLCQTISQNHEDETTRLPPLRPRIFVGGSTPSLVSNVPASHRCFAIADRRIQCRATP